MGQQHEWVRDCGITKKCSLSVENCDHPNHVRTLNVRTLNMPSNNFTMVRRKQMVIWKFLLVVAPMCAANFSKSSDEADCVVTSKIWKWFYLRCYPLSPSTPLPLKNPFNPPGMDLKLPARNVTAGTANFTQLTATYDLAGGYVC